MSIPVITFFNNKGGVGKTSLVYHLAWTYADSGKRILVADLDPQANLTVACLDDERLEELWPEGQHEKTIYGCIAPLIGGTGDILSEPYVENIAEGLDLLVGDLKLSLFEDHLSSEWPKCGDSDERAFRVMSALWRTIQFAGEQNDSELVLVDVGPNLGAINRAILISSNFLVVPLTPDLFSMQGLLNLGPTLSKWRNEWLERRKKNPAHDLQIPKGLIDPLGYIVMQHSIWADRPVKAYRIWMDRIVQVYYKEVAKNAGGIIRGDPTDYCLGNVKHYRSLMPMAQEARKPIFHLTPADGAIGSHLGNVRSARDNFKQLASKIEEQYSDRSRLGYG